jgi:hypothetical protein
MLNLYTATSSGRPGTGFIFQERWLLKKLTIITGIQENRLMEQGVYYNFTHF